MRTREKIRILKRMRREIELKFATGFCGAYHWATKSPRRSSDIDFEKAIIELGLKKPKRNYRGDWWYATRGTRTRLRKIDELIKQLSK